MIEIINITSFDLPKMARCFLFDESMFRFFQSLSRNFIYSTVLLGTQFYSQIYPQDCWIKLECFKLYFWSMLQKTSCELKSFSEILLLYIRSKQYMYFIIFNTVDFTLDHFLCFLFVYSAVHLVCFINYNANSCQCRFIFVSDSKPARWLFVTTSWPVIN